MAAHIDVVTHETVVSGVVIEPGAVVKNSILWDRAVVKAGTYLENCVVGEYHGEAFHAGAEQRAADTRRRKGFERNGEFVVEGIRTTIPFHVELLADPRVQDGDYHVEFLEQRSAASGRIAT